MSELMTRYEELVIENANLKTADIQLEKLKADFDKLADVYNSLLKDYNSLKEEKGKLQETCTALTTESMNREVEIKTLRAELATYTKGSIIIPEESYEDEALELSPMTPEEEEISNG